MRLLAAAAVLAGCYRAPAVLDCVIECPAEECPDGTTCGSDGYCHSAGGEELCTAGSALALFSDGDTGVEEPLAIDVDSTRILLGGQYSGAYRTIATDGAGDYHGFVSAYRRDGTFDFAIDFGSDGPSEITISAVALVDAGEIVVAGQADPVGTLEIGGTAQPSACHGAFAARIGSDRAVSWIYCVPNAGGAEALVVDRTGDVYVAGWIASSAGEADGHVFRLDGGDPSGSTVWSKMIGTSPQEESFHSLALTDDGTIVAAAGETSGASDQEPLFYRFEADDGSEFPVDLAPRAGNDAVLALALGPEEQGVARAFVGGVNDIDGGLVASPPPQEWTNLIQGEMPAVRGLALSEDGGELVACGVGFGYAGAPIDPDSYNGALREAFVLGLDAATGARNWGRLLAGAGEEVASACTVFGGRAFVTGTFEGTSFLPPDQLQSSGPDLFVVVLQLSRSF